MTKGHKKVILLWLPRAPHSWTVLEHPVLQGHVGAKRYFINQLSRVGGGGGAVVPPSTGGQHHPQGDDRHRKSSTGTEKSLDSNPFLLDANFDEESVSGFKRKNKQLRWKKKLQEFYAAPVTKYYFHSVRQGNLRTFFFQILYFLANCIAHIFVREAFVNLISDYSSHTLTNAMRWHLIFLSRLFSVPGIWCLTFLGENGILALGPSKSPPNVKKDYYIYHLP